MGGRARAGFAVVAGEVRSLAGRSAEAAKEIKAMSEQAQRLLDVVSVFDVGQGRQLGSAPTQASAISTASAAAAQPAWATARRVPATPAPAAKPAALAAKPAQAANSAKAASDDDWEIF